MLYCIIGKDEKCFMDPQFVLWVSSPSEQIEDFLLGFKVKKDTRFKKGGIPWNKNLKGIHLSPKSEFKKGQIGVHWVPVGTQNIRPDKKGSPRRWIKIAEPNKWMPYAQHVWLKSGRTIPKGHLLHHKDRDTTNDDINNLKLVTRSQHMKIHWNEIYYNGKHAHLKRIRAEQQKLTLF